MSFKTEAATLSALRGWFTRDYNEVVDLVAMTRDTEASSAVEDAKKALGRLEERYTKVKNAVVKCNNCTDATTDNRDDVYKKLQENTDSLMAIKKEAYEVFGRIEREAADRQAHIAQAQAAGGNGGGKCKLNNALKPPELTKSYSAAEFRHWRDRFRAYYNDSNIVVCKPEIQQQYLVQCLDQDIGCRLHAAVQRNWPIYDEPLCAGNCMEELVTIFNSIHPLPIRRLDLIRLKREQGEEWGAWSARLKAAAREADLATFHADDLIALLFMVNSNAPALEEEFAKLPNPTLAAVENAGNVWQRRATIRNELKSAEKAQKAAAQEKATVQQARGQQQQQQQQQPQQQKSQGKGGRKKDKGQTKKSLVGKCYACGDTSHSIRECANRHTFTCDACGRKGHKASVCMRGYRDAAEARVAASSTLSVEEEAFLEQERYAKAAEANMAYTSPAPAQAQAARSIPPLAAPSAYIRRVRTAPKPGTKAYARAAKLGPSRPTPPMET